MKLTQWIVSGLTLCSVNAYCVEWDAKQIEVGAGVGYASFNDEGYVNAPVFDISIGLNVPLFVERHTRVSGLLSLSEAPVYAEETGEVGGNYTAFNTSFFIEHDLSFGARKAWYGIGLKGSVSYTVDEFEVLENGGSISVDSSLTPSAAFLGRFEIPVANSFSVSINGQYSPLDGAFSGAGAQLIMRF